MAVTLRHEHHRNPSGFHNKVKWLLSVSKRNIDKLYSVYYTVVIPPRSNWYCALDIALNICEKYYERLNKLYPQYWYWIKEYVNEERKIRKKERKIQND